MYTNMVFEKVRGLLLARSLDCHFAWGVPLLDRVHCIHVCWVQYDIHFDMLQVMGWENMAFVFFNRFLDLSEVRIPCM